MCCCDSINIYTLEEFNNLPPDTVCIGFGDDFNHPLNNFPLNLKHISFGCDFDQFIDNLPDTVTSIDINSLDYPEKNIKKLPPYLETISVDIYAYIKHFSQDLDFWMPNVKELTLSEYPYKPIKLPPKLEKLIIGWDESGESVTEELVKNFNNYVTSLGKYGEPGIKFGNKEIVFMNQIEDTFCKLVFRNGDVEENKDRFKVTYEECEQFLLQGYNTKQAKSN